MQRQKLPADWHKRLQAIQAKVTEAVKDLPAGLLAGLPGGAEAAVDYYKAAEIRDKLAQTGERTLFGGLTGQAGAWDKIVKAYENGGEFSATSQKYKFTIQGPVASNAHRCCLLYLLM